MTDVAFFRALEIDAQELEGIAGQYSKDSPQYGAIRRAAWALLYVIMNRREDFAGFLTDMAQELSDSERQHLRAYGLEIEDVSGANR